MREEILRRLLVAKQLLAANSGQLTPNSDAAAVARMVLLAHDAAELAVAAIASHLNVPGLSDRTYLADYPSKIEKQTGAAFSGGDFVRQLNACRIGFKHHGILPDARDWYRVINNTWEWLDHWCREYLKVSINEVDLEQLLADPDVKALYMSAKECRGTGRHREALEFLGHALFHVLRGFRAIEWAVVGRKSTEDALMLSAFGVRPSDFLALQAFLPNVRFDITIRKVELAWEQRETGHVGNWTDENVQFCLETFLDLALKIQYAPPTPRALHFTWVFDDVITPKGESAELFEYVFDGPPILQQVIGRKVMMTLRKGERLRCRLSPSEIEDKRKGLEAIFRPKATLQTADVLSVWLDATERDPAKVRIMYVERKEVEIGIEAKDDEFVRSECPHLFEQT